MKNMLMFARCLILVLSVLFFSNTSAFAAESKALNSANGEAVLEFNFRTIFIFHQALFGLAPQQRVERALDKLNRLSAEQMDQPVELLPYEAQGIKVFALRVDGVLLFSVAQTDIELGSTAGLEETAKATADALSAALSALRDQRRPEVIIKGLVAALFASVVSLALLWLIARARHWLVSRMEIFIKEDARAARLRWAHYGWIFVRRLALLITGFLWLSVAYLWLTYVLECFPVTAPLGRKLGHTLADLVTVVGEGMLGALPSMLTVLVIIFLTKTMNDVMANVFTAVREGRAQVIGLHKETASATQRIVSVMVWGFGIAIAYPFIPLSNSDAFKGLSVMFGFMLTLGSAGIVNQLMSGLVLVYSRALSVGDFVDLGETVGVVSEVGVLATKIINMRNEEVTVPNAVLINHPIKNYSRLAGERGTLVSTKVTIGYDTPWRQVHAMLIAAAELTEGLRNLPQPFVYQRGLADFYVEYELFAHMDNPLQRVPVLSQLHANIQDQFNLHGVQIMSPHFVVQPENNVVVPREQWHAPPAKPE